MSAQEYERLELRAHSLLSGVPLHDVWCLDLPGGGPGRTVEDLRELLSSERLAEASPVVKLLFGLRTWLGRLLRWDDESGQASAHSYLHRLTDADREASLVPPGTPDGPFRVLLVLPREAISETRNATVHAFSVFVLLGRGDDYRLYWAIYVAPVGRITGWYMRLIDPFRRLLVYPAVLRRIGAAWPPDAPR